MLGQSYSSKFSPWLATGCLSPRFVYHCKRYEAHRVKNKSTYWLGGFEMLVRDYFQFQAVRLALNIKSQGNNDWPNRMATHMRELLATGFMSNRGRQNVASFLILDLKVDWRLGAEWFEEQLLDHVFFHHAGSTFFFFFPGLLGGRLNKFNILKQSKQYVCVIFFSILNLFFVRNF
eukprot:GSMAST32.ASY1.ANO1.2684.1 assembled CDS